MPNNFYVHIVESPSPADLLDGRTEGRALCSFLDIAEIPYYYNLAVDKTQLSVAMTDRIISGGQFFELPPILHFSAHGNDQGIQLTNQREAGLLITWAELSSFVKPIHQVITGGVGVCMSSCGGAHGQKMAQVILPKDVPFAWIVGTPTAVEVRDAALAFGVFYRGFQRGESGDRLLAAVRAASGVDAFNIKFGNLTQ